MARIAGVDIPNDKPVAYSLAYIYGIGIPTGKKICADAKVDPTKRVKDLTEAELTAIRSKVAEYKVEGDLRREVNLNIKRLQETGKFCGILYHLHSLLRNHASQEVCKSAQVPAPHTLLPVPAQ